MKKQTVCALLCVAALNISSVTPAIAAELTDALQTQSEAEEQQEQLTDSADQASADTENNAEQNVAQDPDTSAAGSDSVQNENVPNNNQNTTDPSDEVSDSITDDENTIPENGWYTDYTGRRKYYIDGQPISSYTIAELPDEDGKMYTFYFDWEGYVANPGRQYTFYYVGMRMYSGNILVDEYGHLVTGWVRDDSTGTISYYDEHFIQACNSFLEEDGKKYYFDSDGNLVRDQKFQVDGITYVADADGVIKQLKNGWESVEDNWYYYEDDELVKDDFRTIDGAEYYFNSDGIMVTGVFYDERIGGNRFAEPDGKIVNATGWYQSSQTGKWYWFEKEGLVFSDGLCVINGKEFYFSEEGEMLTGAFKATYQDENGEWITAVLFADRYGAIDRKPGWKLDAGNWYYVKSNGESVYSSIETIGGKSYYFDYAGVMRTGFIDYVYDGSDFHTYIANTSGALYKNQWVKSGNHWYYTDKSGEVCKNQWIDNIYYVDSNGEMVVGSYQIYGKTYVFNEYGAKVAVIGEKNGWQLIDGDWYYAVNGKVYNGWLNHTYYLKNGKMCTETTVPAESDADKYSYVGADGTIQNGWVYTLAEQWLYAKKDAQTGRPTLVRDCWEKINGKWYYFDGIYMVSGTVMELEGKVNQFAASGAWMGYITKEGWVDTASGETYYIKADGSINKENMEIDGIFYYFYDWGPLMTNVSIEETDSDGNTDLWWINSQGILDAHSGWKWAPGGIWSYNDGYGLVTGNRVINGKMYRFYGDGMMVNDCYMEEEDGRYALYDKNGIRTYVSTGWYLNKETDGDVWYYFQNGRPYTGNVGAYYVQDGRMVTGMFAGYMYDNDGRLVTNRWVYLSNKWYYAGNTGKIYKGTCYVNGKAYLFDQNGAMIKAL